MKLKEQKESFQGVGDESGQTGVLVSSWAAAGRVQPNHHTLLWNTIRVRYHLEPYHKEKEGALN